jgi:hypothetical protein
VRHQFVIVRSGRNLAGPPHQGRDTPTTFKAGAFHTAERRGAGVGPGILPGTIVGRHDHDGVGRLRADGIHDPADVVVEFQHGIRIVAEMGLPSELRRRIVRVVHLHEVDIHEEGLVALGMCLDIFDRRVSLFDIERR